MSWMVDGSRCWIRVLAGGAQAVQLREKTLPDGELLMRVRVFVKKCRKAGACFPLSMTGRISRRLLAGADGVHVGQDDMPCYARGAEVGGQRDDGGGFDVHLLELAEQAVRDGATYVAGGADVSNDDKREA